MRTRPGSVAIEALGRGRISMRRVAAISCPETMRAVSKEREVLEAYGGGCHQKIGMAVLERPYGRISFLRGRNGSSMILDEVRLEPAGSASSSGRARAHFGRTKPGEAPFWKHGRFLRPSRRFMNPALWTAKARPLPAEKEDPFGTICWAAGTETWRKLARRGVWVNGCAIRGENMKHSALSSL